MKKTFFLLSAALGISMSITSCKQEDYEKTANDLQYKILTDNKQPKAQPGQVIKYNLYWRTAKDSLFLSTAEKKMPYFSKVDKPKTKGDPIEILGMLGVGDSASCLVPADLIFRGSPPPFIHHGDFMKLDFKVLDVISEDEYNKMMNANAATQASNEDAAMQAYMTAHNLKGIKTESGLYVVIEDPGTGKQPKTGSMVKVLYTGTLLNGAKFDASADHGNQPYEFPIGGQVIAGWNEGIPYFKAGGKGKLIIPSKLGYGEQGNGERIPPNSPLAFDIQLVDVQ